MSNNVIKSVQISEDTNPFFIGVNHSVNTILPLEKNDNNFEIKKLETKVTNIEKKIQQDEKTKEAYLKEAKKVLDGSREKSKKILSDAETQANSIIETAKLKAEQIIKNAELDVDKKKIEMEKIVKDAEDQSKKIYENAKLDGFNAGKKDGLENFKSETNILMERLEYILKTAVDEKWEILNSSKKTICNLVRAISEKIIKQEISQNNKVVINNIVSASLNSSERDTVVVKINNSDIDSVNRYYNLIEDAFKYVKNIEIKGDRNIIPGGCVIETNFGLIDGRIDSQIDEVFQELNAKAKL